MIENFQDADVDFEENDFSLQYIRGIALYELGDYEEALAPLNALLAEEQVTEMLEDLFPGGNAESRFQEALNKCLEEEEFDSFNGLGTIRSSHSD
ncbi:MAG: hypothetical protein KDD60_04240, partial [Bdellovibrionales bacterium]|nr:hypothetical protein [Bdellovibrionales bacterium]